MGAFTEGKSKHEQRSVQADQTPVQGGIPPVPPGRGVNEAKSPHEKGVKAGRDFGKVDLDQEPPRKVGEGAPLGKQGARRDSTRKRGARQAGGMAISGRLEVVLKFGEMPTGVETDKNGWKSFEVECGGKVVKLRVRPKNWNKLEQAQKEWPQWVAAAGGVLDVVEGAMVMPEANIQVFERKLKPAAPAEPAAAPAEPSPEPKAG